MQREETKTHREIETERQTGREKRDTHRQGQTEMQRGETVRGRD